MDKEKFKIASSINFEIHELKKGLKSLEGSCWDKEVIIEVRKDYSDRGRDRHARAYFDKEVGRRIGDAVRTIVENRIKELEEEFKSL